MFWKPNKKTNQFKDRSAIVFDFGSSSVKLLAVRYGDDAMEVLGGKKLNLPEDCYTEQGVRVTPELRLRVKESFIALTAIFPDVKFSRAIIGFGGSYVEGFTSQINYRRSQPSRAMTESEVDRIFGQISERANQIMRKMIAWETEEEGAGLISSEIIDITIDGYALATPIGSSGSRLSVVVYNAYTKSSQLSATLKFVRELGLEVVLATSTMYSILRQAEGIKKSNDSFGVLDVGGYGTELGVVQQGRILGHMGFDVAGGSFTASIASQTKTTFAEAELNKLKFAAGQLDDATASEIRESIEYDCKVFSSGVELVLKEFPGLQIYPKELLVAGGGGLLPGVAASLANLGSDTAGESVISLHTTDLLPKAFPGWRDLTGTLNSPADIATLSLALDGAELISEDEFRPSFIPQLFKH